MRKRTAWREESNVNIISSENGIEASPKVDWNNKKNEQIRNQASNSKKAKNDPGQNERSQRRGLDNVEIAANYNQERI